MGILGVLRDKGASIALEKLLNEHLGDAVSRYGCLKRVAVENGELRITLVLNGFEPVVDICCADIAIADDGSTLTINRFSSNVVCVEQALNDFATAPIAIANKDAWTWLRLVKKLLF